MCSICNAKKNGITKVRPTLDMCDEHYMEWVHEKLLGEDF